MVFLPPFTAANTVSFLSKLSSHGVLDLPEGIQTLSGTSIMKFSPEMRRLTHFFIPTVVPKLSELIDDQTLYDAGISLYSPRDKIDVFLL